MNKILGYAAMSLLLASCVIVVDDGTAPQANAKNISTPTATPTKTVSNNSVLFSADSSILDDSAKAVLRSQATVLKNTSLPIKIEGHAEETGTREYNMALGAQRAAAVRDYLVSQGIAQTRMSIVTFGKERPLATCSSEECWAKNRRAVTVVG